MASIISNTINIPPIEGQMVYAMENGVPVINVYHKKAWHPLRNSILDMQTIEEFDGINVVDTYSVVSISSLSKNGLYRSTSELTKNVLWFSIHDGGRSLHDIRDLKTIQQYTKCSVEELVIFAIKYGEDFA